MPTWPAWWEWELELSSHLIKRMADRNFSELYLRRMLSIASDVRGDIVPGRWVVKTRHRGTSWMVIVEPDVETHLLIVITAYPLE